MVTREDVNSAYRFILGREPESEEVIQHAMMTYSGSGELRESFLNCPEFQGRISNALLGTRFPLDLDSELPIEVKCDPARLGRLLERIERTWTYLGKSEPYWSVITADSFRSDQFQQNQDAFWSSGNNDVLRFTTYLRRNGMEPDPGWICLEYGCGTGRITRWLSNLFTQVIACDISDAHLKLARQALSQMGVPGVTWIQISSLGVLDRLPAFDVLFSIIVLQHNPPPVIAHILDTLLGRMKNGGVAFFQVPTLRRGYSFSTSQYLDDQAGHHMEMHVLPQRHVFEIAQRNSCDVLEVQPDNMVGTLDYVSNTFLMRKR